MSLIETYTPFSKSKIWELQRGYFESRGIDAWRTGEVPHYVTSNPIMGKTYAELVFAFLQDLSRQSKTQETVYLLELGAGHGRLCYHFFKHFEKLLSISSVPLSPFCYVLSDIVEENLVFWKTHPRLQPYFEKGWLDFARVDASQPEEIRLRYSGKTIKAGSLDQPLIVAANYFFDTIPQELFYADQGQLCQSLVELTMDGQQQGTIPVDLLSHVQLNYKNNVLDEPPYPEEYLNMILREYNMSLNDTYVLFPHTGIQCLNSLKNFSKNGLLLLTADKGYYRQEDVEGRPAPQLITHGSFSLSVNYHAIKRYAENQRGLVLFPKDYTGNVVLGSLLLVNKPEDYKETLLAYERFVADFGPDDFFDLKKLVEKVFSEFSVQNFLSVLKLSHYDARMFCQMLPALLKILPEVSEAERWSLFKAMHRVWDTYYPLGEEDNVAFVIGEVLFNLEFHREALTYFQLSARLYGKSADTLYNIALCHAVLNEHTQAGEVIDTIIENHPNYELTQQLVNYVREKAEDPSH